MKIITFLTLQLFFFNAFAQKVALIDNDFKKPILFTDSVTVTQVSNNYFPVRVTDVDSLLANLNYLKSELNTIQRSKFKSFKLRAGETYITITTVPHAYGDSYDILMTTSLNNVNAEYLLSDNKGLNKRSVKKIESFYNYIKKDSQITISEFKQFSPMILDATIYISSKKN